MKLRHEVTAGCALLLIGVFTTPAIVYAVEDRQVRAERERVHALIHVGQDLAEAQEVLRENGYGFYSETPTRYRSYQQLLVIVGDPEPSSLDTLFYTLGSNPFRSESPYANISASLDGVITKIR